MSVASHLGIDLNEFDACIRTFIPYYDELLDAAASVVPPRTKTIVDLGIGTGALSARCLAVARRARVVGVDSDRGILQMAARRLGHKAELVEGDFQTQELPRCDLVVASLALHHVKTRAAKALLYRRIARALLPGGMIVNADCCPAEDDTVAARQLRAWRDHLLETYSTSETRAHFRGWSHEDSYMPLNVEIELVRAAGFRTEVVWRRDPFAVVVGWKKR